MAFLCSSYVSSAALYSGLCYSPLKYTLSYKHIISAPGSFPQTDTRQRKHEFSHYDTSTQRVKARDENLGRRWIRNPFAMISLANWMFVTHMEMDLLVLEEVFQRKALVYAKAHWAFYSINLFEKVTFTCINKDLPNDFWSFGVFGHHTARTRCPSTHTKTMVTHNNTEQWDTTQKSMDNELLLVFRWRWVLNWQLDNAQELRCSTVLWWCPLNKVQWLSVRMVAHEKRNGFHRCWFGLEAETSRAQRQESVEENIIELDTLRTKRENEPKFEANRGHGHAISYTVLEYWYYLCWKCSLGEESFLLASRGRLCWI